MILYENTQNDKIKIKQQGAKTIHKVISFVFSADEMWVCGASVYYSHCIILIYISTDAFWYVKAK